MQIPDVLSLSNLKLLVYALHISILYLLRMILKGLQMLHLQCHHRRQRERVLWMLIMPLPNANLCLNSTLASICIHCCPSFRENFHTLYSLNYKYGRRKCSPHPFSMDQCTGATQVCRITSCEFWLGGKV